MILPLRVPFRARGGTYKFPNLHVVSRRTSCWVHPAPTVVWSQGLSTGTARDTDGIRRRCCVVFTWAPSKGLEVELHKLLLHTQDCGYDNWSYETSLILNLNLSSALNVEIKEIKSWAGNIWALFYLVAEILTAPFVSMSSSVEEGLLETILLPRDNVKIMLLWTNHNNSIFSSP